MKKIIIVIVAAAGILSIWCPAAIADRQESLKLWTAYYKLQPLEPNNCPPDPAAWTAVPSFGAVDITIPAGATLWIAGDNVFWETNFKMLQVLLDGTNLGDLNNAQNKPKGFRTCLDSSDIIEYIGTVSITPTGNKAIFKYSFDPQPDWELFKFVNTGTSSVTITSILIDSECSFVPTLTEWGLILLVILMIAASFIVYRGKKSARATG